MFLAVPGPILSCLSICQLYLSTCLSFSSSLSLSLSRSLSESSRSLFWATAQFPCLAGERQLPDPPDAVLTSGDQAISSPLCVRQKGYRDMRRVRTSPPWTRNCCLSIESSLREVVPSFLTLKYYNFEHHKRCSGATSLVKLQMPRQAREGTSLAKLQESTVPLGFLERLNLFFSVPKPRVPGIRFARQKGEHIYQGGNKMSHNENPVLKWSTQNHVKNCRGGRTHLWLGFYYPPITRVLIVTLI